MSMCAPYESSPHSLAPINVRDKWFWNIDCIDAAAPALAYGCRVFGMSLSQVHIRLRSPPTSEKKRLIPVDKRGHRRELRRQSHTHTNPIE
ncbi:hypothetical protein K443DRAFT_378668 [Laccaria amethystina LaAM-08-1]|uniref:Uncharacterized protein n=1 Tax=Laccaria amethystina LaAM-08-1 TaxID=1095629 RepID=A0A0C9WYY1_9AGAR|nr:hypothetical protein K443DRAFT_378668 [Laccaria amethystina LaAM-08-1]